MKLKAILILKKSGMISSVSRRAKSWVPVRRPWSRQHKNAKFPSCGSTSIRWCSLAMASTSSASRPPSPARRRTSPWKFPATRKTRTTCCVTWACRFRSSDWFIRSGRRRVARPDRFPGRGQTTGRQSWPWRFHQPGGRRPGQNRLWRGPRKCARAQRSGGKFHRGNGPPHAGGER